MKLAIHDLEGDEGRRHAFGNDDRERDAFASRLEGWVDGIRSGVFRPVEDRSICPECDFRRFCRYAPCKGGATQCAKPGAVIEPKVRPNGSLRRFPYAGSEESS